MEPAIKALFDYGVAVSFAAILLVSFLRYHSRLVVVNEKQTQLITVLVSKIDGNTETLNAIRSQLELTRCRYPGFDWVPKHEKD